MSGSLPASKTVLEEGDFKVIEAYNPRNTEEEGGGFPLWALIEVTEWLITARAGAFWMGKWGGGVWG